LVPPVFEVQTVEKHTQTPKWPFHGH